MMSAPDFWLNNYDLGNLPITFKLQFLHLQNKNIKIPQKLVVSLKRDVVYEVLNIASDM